MDATKPAPSPVATDQAKAKLLGIIVHQQQLQLQMTQLETQYRSLAGEAETLKNESAKAQTEAIKSAGLEVDKYTVNVTPSGEVTLVPKPVTAPSTPSTEKK